MVQPANYNIDVQSPFQAFAQGAQLGTGLAEIQARRQAQEQDVIRQQQLNQAVQTLNANPNPTAKDYQQLSFLLPPAQMKSVLDVFQAGTKEQQDNQIAFSGKVLSAFTAGQPQIGIDLLTERATAEENRGNKAQAKAFRDYAELARLNPNAAQKTIGVMLASLPGGDKIIEATTKAQLAPSDVSKAETEASFAPQIKAATLAKLNKELKEDDSDSVQSGKILPDGTTIILTKKGKTRVLGSDGVELAGDERVQRIRDAEEFGADIQGLRSGARAGAEIGQKEAQKAFELVGKIRTNLGNLDSAVAALDAGANTGIIASKFPNWKASTIELQNVQRRLGLDIIGSVTFGALSEGELSLALETALPLNMNEKQLRDWLLRKRDAQIKLSNYVSEQAKYLSVPGRNLGNWLEFAEKKYGSNVPAGGMTAPGTGGRTSGATPAPTGGQPSYMRYANPQAGQ
jgi:hypothetical protein